MAVIPSNCFLGCNDDFNERNRGKVACQIIRTGIQRLLQKGKSLSPVVPEETLNKEALLSKIFRVIR